MSGTGRRRVLPYEELKVMLKERRHEWQNPDGGVHVPSHECWTRLADLLQESGSVQKAEANLRKHIWTLVKYKRINLDSDEEESGDSSSEVSESDAERNTLTFAITIPVEEWSQLKQSSSTVAYKSCDRTSSRKEYGVLRPGLWTSIVSRHIHEATRTKLRCTVSFKRCKLYPRGVKYLRIEGYCNNCNSLLHGEMLNDCGEGPAIINITYTGGYQRCCGGRKRRLNDEERTMYGKLLTDAKQSASRVQKEAAATIMKRGDIAEPPHLPTLNTLRIIKHRSKAFQPLDPDPIMSVIRMKQSQPYDCTLRNIGYDPFHLHYWSAAQVNAYRVYTRRNKFPSVSIDATGSIVKRINLMSGRTTKAVFFHQVVVHDGESQYPVAEMISEQHNNTAISFWLQCWLREDIPAPRICVTDQSSALMMACVRAFTQFPTLNAYLAACASLLIGDEGVEVPYCMIRNDFAHVMKLISTWDEIKNAPPRTKNFYMRAAALIISSTSYSKIKCLYRSLFVVLLSERDGIDEDTREETTCEKAKNYLKNLMGGLLKNSEGIFGENGVDSVEHECDSIRTELDDANGLVADRCDADRTTIYNEIEQLYVECKELGELERNCGNNDNAQFCPPLAKKFVELSKLLPIWSGVMVPIFGFGSATESSKSSESLFKELKMDIFRSESLPMRLDEFLEIHIKTFTGRMNLINVRHKDYKQEDAETILLGEKSDEKGGTVHIQNDLKGDESQSSPTSGMTAIRESEAVENWRGLTEGIRR